MHRYWVALTATEAGLLIFLGSANAWLARREWRLCKDELSDRLDKILRKFRALDGSWVTGPRHYVDPEMVRRGRVGRHRVGGEGQGGWEGARWRSNVVAAGSYGHGMAAVNIICH